MNPVTIIRSYLEIILSDLHTGLSDEQVEFMKSALAAALRLNGLIDSIVELAALEIGAAEIDFKTVDVGALVVEACQAKMKTAESAGVELCLPVDPHLLRVRADGDRLRSTVAELVTNAIQSTPRGGRVEVSLMQRGSDVVIGVSDTGTGIPEDLLSTAFEPFVRLPAQEGVSRRGAGLGLSLAQRNIDAIGGRIEVSSEVGSGTSFEIVLPVQGSQE
jgi:signal transduction histidine kinase